MARVGLTSGSLEAFAHEVLGAAESVTGTLPPTVVPVLDARVRVGFSSEALRGALAPAWAALRSAGPDAGAPLTTDDVSIHVLDRDSAGDPPAPPWPRDAYAPRDEIVGFGGESLEVAYQLSSGTLMMWDAQARRGLWWTTSAAQIPTWERAMPLRAVLRWALRDLGLALVHGAAVGPADRMALLVGAGGSGKSTLALAAQLAGWRYVADDYCVVDPHTSRVAPVTGFAKATDGTLRLLPGLAALDTGDRTPDDKHVLALRPDPVATLGAVVLPTLSGSSGPAAAASAARTMAALAPTSLLQMPGSRASDRGLLADLVRSVPGWTLASGPDLDETLGHLRRLLEAS